MSAMRSCVRVLRKLDLFSPPPQDQQVAQRTRYGHQCLDRWQVFPHPLSRLVSAARRTCDQTGAKLTLGLALHSRRKLTRILQESLGGNSRTTLIINASPCAYNVDETISTLRFGVRAKSIKNKARVNAELSPAELKALLKKSQGEAARYQQYIAALEAELKVWRSGGSVAESERAELGKMALVDPASAPSALAARARPQTPATPSGIEALKELSSRPDTPTAVSLDPDEREQFLRRENELSDTLAQKEREHQDLSTLHDRLQEEYALLQESATRTAKDKDAASAELTELKLKHSALIAENKDIQTMNDSLRGEIDTLTTKLAEAESGARRRAVEDDPEAENRRKEKDARVKAMLESTAGVHATSDPALQLRENLKQLEGPGDHKEKVLDTVEKLHQENIQLQARLDAYKLEHDNLLIDKDNAEIRLRDLQAAHAKMVARGGQDAGFDVNDLRAGIEAQFQAQRRALEDEVADLKRTMEAKQQEYSNVENERGALRMANEELRRAFASAASTGAGGGASNEEASAQLLETAKEMERVRRSMAGQLSDFDQTKKSLMRDLQNRCEKVVELEISLDESKEQYNNVVRSSNTKAQQKKMAFLERNLEQLTSVQKQLVEQNSSLKKEVAIAERKLNARNERIQSLEALLTESQERINQQNAKYEAQMALVRERFESARNLSRSMGNAPPGAAGQAQAGMGGAGGAANPGLAFGRIAKPLRGGGAQAGPQPGPAAVSAGAPRHPGVSNVQQQAAQFDSKSPKARSSWFFSSS